MKITYSITEKDVWEFSKYINFRTFVFKLYVVLIFLFHLAIILSIFYKIYSIYALYGLITGDLIGFYLKYSLTKKVLLKIHEAKAHLMKALFRSIKKVSQ